MRHQTQWGRAYYWARRVLYIAGTANLVAGFVAASDEHNPGFWTVAPGEEPSALFTIFNPVRENTWWLIPSLFGVCFAAEFARRYIGSPAMWETVHRMLDKYRAHVFAGSNGDANHHHRVTLFKISHLLPVCRWPPFTRCLCAIERSGYTTRGRALHFKLPEGPDGAEGIAGEAWRQNRPVFVNDLPLATSESPDDVLRAYADKTGVTLTSLKKWVARKKRRAGARKPVIKLPRSFAAHPIRLGNDDPWGVIVIDSLGKEISTERVLVGLKLLSGPLEVLLKGIKA